MSNRIVSDRMNIDFSILTFCLQTIVQHLLLNKLLILTFVQDVYRPKGGAHSPYSAGACPMGTGIIARRRRRKTAILY